MLKNRSLDLSIDQYAITVAYALYKQNKHKDQAVCELFYRKPCTNEFPFIVLAGCHYVLEFLSNARITEEDIAFLQQLLPSITDEGFYTYLRSVSIDSFEVSVIAEGNFIYGNVPLIKLKGDTALLLLFEASMLSIMNLCSSAATAAFLLYHHAKGRPIVEMGLRRSFGIEAGYMCSLYGAMSGFRSSSNLISGKDFGLPTIGTMSHSFILSFDKEDTFDDVQLSGEFLKQMGLGRAEFLAQFLARRERFGFQGTNKKELKAYLSYAQAFPAGFTALLDTFSTYDSGIKNYALVASMIAKVEGCRLGVRIDSGNLITESLKMRSFLKDFDAKFGFELAAQTKIIATNDVNVAFLRELAQTESEIDVIGIGTNYATFKDIKPIGFVYKVAEINGQARFKTASGLDKATLPFDKDVYRIVNDKDELGIVVVPVTQAVVPGPFKGYYLDEAAGSYQPVQLVIASAERLLNKVTKFGQPFGVGEYQETFKRCHADLDKRKGYARWVIYSPQIIELVIELLGLNK